MNTIDQPQPSINTFMNVVRSDPQWNDIPETVRQAVENLEINNPVDLLKDLRVRASIFINHGRIDEAKTILEFTQRLAKYIGDNEIELQISAWIALMDDDEKQLILEVRDMIQAEIRQTPEFKKFLDSVINKS